VKYCTWFIMSGKFSHTSSIPPMIDLGWSNSHTTFWLFSLIAFACGRWYLLLSNYFPQPVVPTFQSIVLLCSSFFLGGIQAHFQVNLNDLWVYAMI